MALQLRHPLVSSMFEEPVFGLRLRANDLFNWVYGEDGSPLQSPTGKAPVSMSEDGDHFYVEIELPGIAESEIKLTVHQGHLYITAERQAPEDQRTFSYNERSFGRVERVVHLPEAMIPEQVEATLSQGILRITLTKWPGSKPRQIEVKGTSSAVRTPMVASPVVASSA